MVGIFLFAFFVWFNSTRIRGGNDSDELYEKAVWISCSIHLLYDQQFLCKWGGEEKPLTNEIFLAVTDNRKSHEDSY